jgi:hypothetical protein
MITMTDAEAKELWITGFADVWYGDDDKWVAEALDAMRRVVNAPAVTRITDKKIRAKWNELHPERRVK